MGEFRVLVSGAADADPKEIRAAIHDLFSFASAIRVDRRIRLAITQLAEMPRRHTHMRELLDRKYEYRRVLVKKPRAIYTINDEEGLVEVVRVDLQSANPASPNDLP